MNLYLLIKIFFVLCAVSISLCDGISLKIVYLENKIPSSAAFDEFSTYEEEIKNVEFEINEIYSSFVGLLKVIRFLFNFKMVLPLNFQI